MGLSKDSVTTQNRNGIHKGMLILLIFLPGNVIWDFWELKKNSKYKLFKMKNFIISSDFFLPAGVFENYFWAVWNFILFCIYLNMICTLYMWGHISLALHINPALEFMLLFPAQASQELGKDSL